MKVKWLVVLGIILVVLGYVSLFNGWNDNWTIALLSGGGFLVFLELTRD